MHTTEMKMLRWIQRKTRKDRITTTNIQERCNVQSNHQNVHTETYLLVWPCNEKRRQECCKCNKNVEGGREETSRKVQTVMDGHSAERYERTPARSKARTEQRSMEKGSHDHRLGKGIRSANVRNVSIEDVVVDA